MLSPETKARQHQTMLRVDKGLYARLADAAREENRSVNQQIVYYIRRALDARETKEGCKPDE